MQLKSRKALGAAESLVVLENVAGRPGFLYQRPARNGPARKLARVSVGTLTADNLAPDRNATHSGTGLPRMPAALNKPSKACSSMTA